MIKVISWLPEIIRVTLWTDQTFESLYHIFSQDFKTTQPVYQGVKIWYFPEMEEGKEVIFWHLTHREDKETRERFPDLRRCERLSWVRSIIDNHEKSDVKAWDFKEADNSIKTYIWLCDLDFLVILKKYPNNSRRIITSFYIDQPHTIRKLQKKFQKRLTQ